MSEISLGTVIRVDSNTGTCSVKLTNGRILTQVGYSFPFYSYKDSTGFMYVPVEGMIVTVIKVDTQYYISGYVLPIGKKFDYPLLPGDFVFAANKFAFLRISASGAIQAQATPSAGFALYPDLAKFELFAERYKSTTSLGEIKVDVDRYGAFLDVNWTDIDAAVPGGNIVKINIESLRRKLFSCTLDRMGKFNVTLFNNVKIDIDQTGRINVKASQITLESPAIALGSMQAREPGVLGLQLQQLLIRLSSMCSQLASVVSSINAPSQPSGAAASPLVAQFISWGASAAKILAKKVRLE